MTSTNARRAQRSRSDVLGDQREERTADVAPSENVVQDQSHPARVRARPRTLMDEPSNNRVNGETWRDFLRSTAETTDGSRYMNGTYGRQQSSGNSSAPSRPYIPAQAASSDSTQSTSRKRLLSEAASSARHERRDMPPPTHRPSHGASGSSANDPIDLTTSPRPLSGQVIYPRRESFPTGGTDIILPPWQPDDDVSNCPVCHTAFSWYYRKHHCRKCGKVVCALCSPHQIRIPKRYVVHPPPTTSQQSSFPPTLSMGDTDSGRTVRVCNPCVPDPNLSPPPQQQRDESSTRLRSASATQDSSSTSTAAPVSPAYNPPFRLPEFLAARRRENAISDPAPVSRRPRDRSISEIINRPTQLPNVSRSSSSTRPERANHFRASQHHSMSSQAPSGAQPAPRSRADWHHRGHQSLHGSSLPAVPRASSSRERYARPEPIDEADQCPICLKALPPLDPSTGSDDLRTAHISRCITRAERRHSNVMSGPQPSASRSVSNTDHQSGSPDLTRRYGPPPPYSGFVGRASLTLMGRSTHVSAYEARDENDEDDSAEPSGVQDMLRFRASVTDCLNIDEKGGPAPECIICFEEFEEGQVLGRLACLCRFHADCLDSWWQTKGTNACPTHMP